MPFPFFEIVVVHKIDSPPGGCLITREELRALEIQMSALSDKLALLTASVEGVKTRVAAIEANATTQADLDAVDIATSELDKVAIPPVVEPTP